ncbi:MAG: hypothetical protein JWN43_50 [Gammaproteobacteria bacterium]|nr:hypothetical protein [Gammaproteobacteria bacterium]
MNDFSEFGSMRWHAWLKELAETNPPGRYMFQAARVQGSEMPTGSWLGRADLESADQGMDRAVSKAAGRGGLSRDYGFYDDALNPDFDERRCQPARPGAV